MNGYSKIKDPLISRRGIAVFCCSPDMFHGCDPRAHIAEWFCWGLESSFSCEAPAQHCQCCDCMKDGSRGVADSSRNTGSICCCQGLRDAYFTDLEKKVITHLNSCSRIYRLCQESENFTCKTHSGMTCSTYLIDSNCLFWFSVNHKFMSYNFICFPCAAVCHSRRKCNPWNYLYKNFFSALFLVLKWLRYSFKCLGRIKDCFWWCLILPIH